jgi:hypothetical protein
LLEDVEDGKWNLLKPTLRSLGLARTTNYRHTDDYDEEEEDDEESHEPRGKRRRLEEPEDGGEPGEKDV